MGGPKSRVLSKRPTFRPLTRRFSLILQDAMDVGGEFLGGDGACLSGVSNGALRSASPSSEIRPWSAQATAPAAGLAAESSVTRVMAPTLEGAWMSFLTSQVATCTSSSAHAHCGVFMEQVETQSAGSVHRLALVISHGLFMLQIAGSWGSGRGT